MTEEWQRKELRRSPGSVIHRRVRNTMANREVSKESPDRAETAEGPLERTVKKGLNARGLRPVP
jgi:hypothetical protein